MSNRQRKIMGEGGQRSFVIRLKIEILKWIRPVKYIYPVMLKTRKRKPKKVNLSKVLSRYNIMYSQEMRKNGGLL